MIIELGFLNISSPEHPFSLPQIIGYLGMSIGVLTFFQKDDRRMKVGMIAMSVVLATHFVMLERFVAAIGSVMAGTRAALSLFSFVHHHAHYFTFFFLCITCVFAYLTYARWIDIFPFMAMICGTFAFFYLHGILLRCVFVFIGCLWLTHNILALSYGPAVMEVFILIANITTIFRLRMDQKNSA